MTELIGQRLGSYQIDALLAAAPTGHLYGGQHVRLGRRAALKVFDSALIARPDVRPRLLAALRAASALRHPHIVTIYDVGEEEDRLFVTTELPAGGNLRALVQPDARDRIPLAVRLDLIAQAAEGLAAAHAAGVVHGAVKPESLWLERHLDEGAPLLKVADLGVAQALPEEAFGAPPYLSPEQCRHDDLDGRADLYSLGVVLYELLVGAPPFRVQSVEAATAKHLRTLPVPPRLVRPELPAEVEAIVLRCLAKSPDERYADAASLAAALREAAAGLGPPAALPEPPAPAPTVTVPPLPVSEQPTVRVPEPAAAGQVPRVQVFGPQGALLHTADLASGALSVGRAPEREIFLDDPQVSREHLRISWDGRRVAVIDPGSANGTFIGDVRLTPGLATPWDQRAELRVGPFTLRLALSAAEAPAEDTLLSGLLGGTPPAPSPAPQPGQVELRVDQELATLTPGTPALITIRLRNTGTAPEDVLLAVEGVPGAWLRERDLQAIRLDPGAQAAVGITVAAPRAPEALAGDYDVVVRARTASGTPGGLAQLRWTVLPFRELELRIAPPEAESRAAANYQVLARNMGNAPATYFLSFHDKDDLLGYTLEQDGVDLEPGETARIGLRVEAAGRLFGGPEERPFAIRADDGQHEAARAEARLTHLATLPPWVLVAALGALAVALVLGGLAFFGGLGGGGVAGVPTATVIQLPPTLTPLPTPLPGAPTVEQLTAEPQVVAPGELVTVTWSVQGAERVFIEQFGDVEAVGQRQFRPEQTTDFRLVAVAPGGRETVVIARVNVAPATATPLPEPTATPEATATLLPTETAVPTATAIPPTETPPIEASPTTGPPTNVPGGTTIDLAAQARDATWRTGSGEVGFGRPLFGAGQGGWAAIADATLEDGQQYEGLLQMVPPDSGVEGEAPFIEGEYELQPLQRGQILAGSVGFAQGVASQSVTVTVSFNGQTLYESVKAADGSLLPVLVDLSPLEGQAGQLALRVSAEPGADTEGVYWVRPRIDVPR